MENPNNGPSSIGANWPPVVASNDRLRGFYTNNVITNQQTANELVEPVHEALQQMERSPDVSRISLRVVAELGALSQLEFDGTTIEAALPIKDTDLLVVYIGANQAGRQIDAARLANHQQLLHRTAQIPTKPLPAESEVSIVDRNTASELAPEFLDLYSIFGYDLADTEDLLASPTNIVAYHEKDDRIVSTAMAERAVVEVEGFGELSIVEITEASTLPEYRGRGLYRQVSGYLTRHLVSLCNDNELPIDILYGESNLAMPGVVFAARQNGRQFSYFDRQRLRQTTSAFGILPQNFAVADGAETRCYNDFAVSYVPLERSHWDVC